MGESLLSGCQSSIRHPSQHELRALVAHRDAQLVRKVDRVQVALGLLAEQSERHRVGQSIHAEQGCAHGKVALVKGEGDARRCLSRDAGPRAESQRAQRRLDVAESPQLRCLPTVLRLSDIGKADRGLSA